MSFGKTSSKVDERAQDTTLLFRTVTSLNAESASLIADADWLASLVPPLVKQRRELDQAIYSCHLACMFQCNHSKERVDFLKNLGVF